jgi:hypothetical protein
MRRMIGSISAALAALAIAGAASAQSLTDNQLDAENSQQAVQQGLAITQQAVEEKYPGEGQKVPTDIKLDGTQAGQAVTSSTVNGALSGSGAAGLAPQVGGLDGLSSGALPTSLGLPAGLSQLTSKF